MFSADVLIVFICISAGYKCYVMMMIMKKLIAAHLGCTGNKSCEKSFWLLLSVTAPKTAPGTQI